MDSQEKARLIVKLADNPKVRRLSGEGWHEKGMNYPLFTVFLCREVAMEEIVESRELELDGPYHQEYFAADERANKIKQENDIGEPPIRVDDIEMV
jgi:hypothetical protein